MGKIKLSVIIPVYNSERYLNKLFNCIKKQDCNLFEIIFVNDGSADDSLKMLQEFKKQNLQLVVKIFSQKNKGVSSARNVGLKNVQGDYLLFVDSDDSFRKNYFSEMVKSIETEKSDLVVSEYCGSKEKKDLLLNISPSVWSKLFRKEMVLNNNLKFNVNIHNEEDFLFLYNYLYYSKKVSTNQQKVYIYNNNGLETLSKRFGSEYITCLLVDKYLKKLYLNSPFEKEIEIVLFRRNLARLVWILRDKNKFQRMKLHEILLKNINEHYSQIKNNLNYNFSDKFIFQIFSKQIFYKNQLLNSIISFLIFKLNLFPKFAKLYKLLSRK